MAKNTILEKYTSLFKVAPVMVSAPGRINIIGEHTDYNDGWVLPAAIDKKLYFALGVSMNEKNVFVASDLDASTEFAFSDIQLGKDATWKDYLQAVIQILLEQNFPIEPTNGVLGGTIPHGAGLSSSAALCCGFVFGLSKLYNFSIPREEIALIAQEAEHRIGLNCGLMDQCAVLLGRSHNALLLDCRSLDYQTISMDLKGYSFVLLNSKIKHALAAGSGYNERRASCERVVHILRQYHPYVSSLRDVSTSMLEKYSVKLDAIDYKRAAYVIAENARVLAVVDAFRQKNLQLVGKILFEAHRAMKEEYEITVPEIDLLVDLAKQQPAVLGARMVGGGFGGCTINLIQNQQKPGALAVILKKYKEHTGLDADLIEVEIGNGVERI